MPIGSQEIGLSALAATDIAIHGFAGTDNHIAVDYLQHVAGGKSDMDAQRQMHIDMGFDAMRQQGVVGIEKDHINVLPMKPRNRRERRPFGHGWRRAG